MAEEMKPLQYNSENRVLQNNMAMVQLKFQKDLEAPPWLKYMESPFRWAWPLKRILMYFGMIVKLREYKNQGSFYGFEKLVVNEII